MALQPIQSSVPIADGQGKPTPPFLFFINQLLNLVSDSAGSLAQKAYDLANTLLHRRIDTGLGLTGGGDLTQDRTISLDASFEELNDVDMTGVADGNVPVWDATDLIWKPGAGGGGGGQFTRLGQVVVSSATPSISFSGLAASCDDLVICISGRSAAAATKDLVRLRLNGDSAAHYDCIEENRFSTTPTSGIADTALSVLSIAGATAPANYVGSVEILIPGYAKTSFYKNVLAYSDNAEAVNATSLYFERWAGYWRSSAAVSSVDLTLSSGANFAIGTVVTIYGRGGSATPSGPVPWVVQATGTGSPQNITIPDIGLTLPQIFVSVDGIKYRTGNYTIAGNVVTLTSNSAGDAIEIIGPIGQGMFSVQATGTGSPQNISLPVSNLALTNVIVNVDGVVYRTSNYSISGTTLTLTSNSAGDAIEIVGPIG